MGQYLAGVVRHWLAGHESRRGVTKLSSSRRPLERAAKESDSLVRKRAGASLVCVLEYCGTREIPWETGETTFQG